MYLMVILLVFRGQFTTLSISKTDPPNCLALSTVGDPIIINVAQQDCKI